MRLRAILITAAIGASPTCFAWTFGDDFESYNLGTFPSANWNDTGLIQPNGNIPNPSSLIERKTTEQGTQTHALNFGDYFGYSSGIYKSTPIDRYYNLTVDVRVDRFSTAMAASSPGDWPVAVGFNKFDAGVNPAGWQSVQVYASTKTKDWRLYGSNGTLAYDIALGATPDIGIWDRVCLKFDNATGTAMTMITDLRTNVVVESRTDTFANWGHVTLDTVGLFNGQSNYGNSSAIASLANVDNVHAQVVPEPTTVLLLGFGAAAVALRRRRKA